MTCNTKHGCLLKQQALREGKGNHESEHIVSGIHYKQG